MPIYGQGDAGRKFWKRFRKVITDNQFRENQIAKAMYVIEENNEVKAMLITHVDDLCWAIMPGYEQHIEKILEEFVERCQDPGGRVPFLRKGNQAITGQEYTRVL